MLMAKISEMCHRGSSKCHWALMDIVGLLIAMTWKHLLSAEERKEKVR